MVMIDDGDDRDDDDRDDDDEDDGCIYHLYDVVGGDAIALLDYVVVRIHISTC